MRKYYTRAQVTGFIGLIYIDTSGLLFLPRLWVHPYLHSKFEERSNKGIIYHVSNGVILVCSTYPAESKTIALCHLITMHANNIM